MELSFQWYISLLGMPQTKCLKQQKFIFSHIWRLEIWDEVVRRIGSLLGPWRQDLFQTWILGL